MAGDRWTLLILRELLGGPARFEDLVGGLPGISRNLLSGRLRRLEEDGVVRRREANGVSLYAVTDLGAAELDMEGEPIEVTLGPQPKTIARISIAPDARIRLPRSVMSAMIVGEPFDDSALEALTGDASLVPALANAMRAPFEQFA